MRPLKEATLPSMKLPMPSSLEDELSGFRSDMLRFARLQLRDDYAAEEAVQDAFVSALDNLHKFDHRAQLKTWVFSILRNKVIDIIKSRARTAAREVYLIEELSADEQFDEYGGWQEETMPSEWGDPERSFENTQFWQVFQFCLNRLPENTARVFMMREILGFDTKEICQELAISLSNCWVVLHRARMALQLCLGERWFNLNV
jgi:RNA polymerase sigma-70 factor (TIGR02943 family)